MEECLITNDVQVEGDGVYATPSQLPIHSTQQAGLRSPGRMKLGNSNGFPASLPFSVLTISHEALNDDLRSVKPVTDVDGDMSYGIVDVLKPVPKGSKICYIFNPQEYPVITNNVEERKRIIVKLQNDLKKCSFDGGNDMIFGSRLQWGGKDRKDHYIKLQLCCKLSKKQSQSDSEKIHQVILSQPNNPKKLSRSQGHKHQNRKNSKYLLPHRSIIINNCTNRLSLMLFLQTESMRLEEPCKCPSSCIIMNDHCFFIRPDNRPKMHSNHGKESQSELAMLRPMLSDKEKEDRQTMAFASQSGSAVAKGIKRKCDVQLSRQNIKNMGLNDKIHCRNATLKKDLSKTNDAEGCRDLLHSYGAKVILLKAIEGEEGCAPVLQYDESTKSSSNSGHPGYLQEIHPKHSFPWEVMVTKGETVLLKVVASNGESSLYTSNIPCLFYAHGFVNLIIHVIHILYMHMVGV